MRHIIAFLTLLAFAAPSRADDTDQRARLILLGLMPSGGAVIHTPVSVADHIADDSQMVATPNVTLRPDQDETEGAVLTPRPAPAVHTVAPPAAGIFKSPVEVKIKSTEDGSCVPCLRLKADLATPNNVAWARHFRIVKVDDIQGIDGVPIIQFGDAPPIVGWSGTADGLSRLFADAYYANQPKLTADDLPPDQQPTPMEGVAATLAALRPQPHEVLVDYGCGFDARYLITACRQYGTRKAIGVEIDPVVAASARAYVAQAGLSDRITIITGDATKVDVTADIGVAYLWPDVLEQLKPRINRLKRFASYAHAVPGIPSTPRGDVYLYVKPTPVVMQQPAPQPVYRRPVAVWNGRQYSGPVCNRRSCSMCAAIRRQLGM
jgi:hypothetical protein